VRIVTDHQEGLQAYAWYRPPANILAVSRRFTESSTFMVADVLAHELKHASDDLHRAHQGPSEEDCLVREQRAFAVERSFLRWAGERFEGLPSSNAVRQTLSVADRTLFSDMTGTLTSRDLDTRVSRMYQGICSRTER
jgi:hypothetical protein